MTTKRIDIDELQPGMFITELDISWIKSPFFRHKRLISKIDDIKLLKKAGVKKILIDLDKSEQARTDAMDSPPEVREKGAEEIAHKAEAGDKPTTLEAELKAATNVKRDVVNAVNSLNLHVENGEPLKLDVLAPIVDKTIASLERNDQALLTLLHQGCKDSNLASHTFGVFTLAMFMAKEQNLSEIETESLALAAMLHDSGWSKLPGNLFAKGKKFSEPESALVKLHITILEKVLEKSELVPQQVRLIIRQHHELGDGSGYPQQLALCEIDPLARLLTICDVYHEFVHGIGECGGMVATKAISEIYKLGQKGVLDPAFTALLAKTMGVYPLGSGVLLDNGEKGVVIETNRTDPLSPIVKVVYGINGYPKLKPNVVRLDKQKRGIKIKIDSVIDPHDPRVDPAGILNLGEA